jgi:hypothetical protein
MAKHEKETYLLDSWGSQFNLSYDEVMSLGFNFWNKKLHERDFLIFKGFDTNLSDADFFKIGSLVGKTWDKEGYEAAKKTKAGFMFDNTVEESILSDTPVSYFYSDRTFFTTKYMAYHADMPHAAASGHQAYPARALFMVNTPKDDSGKTTWLDLEGTWAQLTEEEKAPYANCQIQQQHMYKPHTEIEVFPFLKTNPWNGKISPRLNCIQHGPNGKTWIRRIIRDGVELSLQESVKIVEDLYGLLESKHDSMYTHTWDNGDVLLYSNFPSVHRREEVTLAPGESLRRLKRITIDLVYPDDFVPEGTPPVVPIMRYKDYQ